MTIELWLPILLLAIAFVGYCWYDLSRVGRTRYLPKWLWAVVSVITIPLGGLLYLLIGRGHDPVGH